MEVEYPTEQQGLSAAQEGERHLPVENQTEPPDDYTHTRQSSILRLPYPVSANRYWRNFGGRMVRSSIADTYKKLTRSAARWAGLTPINGPVEVWIELHPKTTRGGQASRTRLDLDNTIKVTLDALNEVAYMDDKQVERIQAWIGEPVQSGGLTVAVRPIAEVRLGR